MTFVETLRGVLRDARWFMAFLALTLWGFAVAFHTLFRFDQDRFEVRS